jgi:EAL domain-containing protein (putative c-di-GMP-specific phosphodiesterase class I)
MTRVLLVDDNEALVRTSARGLARHGHAVDTALDAVSALTMVKSSHYDVIVSDIRMPGADGLEFLHGVRQIDVDVPVVLMTGDPDLETAMKAVNLGAYRYLAKPVSIELLDETIRKASQMHTLAALRRQALEITAAQASGVEDRVRLEERFASAVDKIWMAFQPIVSWTNRRVVGFEALVRSDEVTLGRPMELIEAAERLGRLTDLGRAVRTRVASATPPPGVNLFVNLHAADLDDDELFDPQSPLSAIAGRVVVELTERASLEHIKDVAARVASLRHLGFRLAVDDLGAGYAGLSSVTQFEPEIIKIDMSLARGIDGNEKKQQVVGSLIRLSSEMRTEIIVEGVETPAERDTLARLGCDLMQGYIFGRPARGFETPSW